MKATIKTENGVLDLVIKWKHQRILDVDKQGETVIHPKGGATFCSIKNYPTGEILTTGVSLCSDSDMFNKDFGRQMSLRRAIESYPKEIRKEIWNCYFSR